MTVTNIALIREKLDNYERLMRLDKPIGTLLLLWPTLWALWLSAVGQPQWWVVWIFALGTLLMRSAGCVINDYADRDFDPHVARTKSRPLAARTVSPREALGLFAVLVLLSFLLLLPLLTPLVFALAAVAVFLAASYPFTKRFFAIPQAYLGIAFGFGIPMSYAAQLGVVPAEAWWLLLANVFWAVAYDTEYAMVDRDDDLKLGLKSSAILFGRHDKRIIGALQLLTLLILLLVGQLSELGSSYYWSLLAAAALFVYQQRLIRERQREACFQAFLNNNYVGAMVLLGVIVHYLQG